MNFFRIIRKVLKGCFMSFYPKFISFGFIANFVFLHVFLHANIPLFDKYPKMSECIPHIKLGNYPSPLVKIEKLSKKLDVKDLYNPSCDLI
jgi:hypothetical protein